MSSIKSLSQTSKRVWLKLDACDVKAILQESVNREWNGDEDLRDGKLEALREEYSIRHQTFREACEGQQDGWDALIQALEGDIPFLQDGLHEAVRIYELKRQQTASEKLLVERCWDVVDYNTLLQQAQAFITTFQQRHPMTQHNQDLYRQYLRNLFKRRRRPATHIMVILASDEKRNVKPYCVPLQYVPYKSIRDQFIRDLTRSIKRELMAAGILVVGKLVSPITET